MPTLKLRRGVILATLAVAGLVVAALIWIGLQPPSIRVAAESFVNAMVSCDEDALYELATPEERERYDRAALGRVCRAMRDDCLGGLELISAKSESPHAAESGDAEAKFRAGDGTEFDCGGEVSRYGERPVGSVVLQMRFMVIRYIMARDGADATTARATFTRDYLPKFQAAGVHEVYLLPRNEWWPMR